jgi:hypothetical protein
MAVAPLWSGNRLCPHDSATAGIPLDVLLLLFCIAFVSIRMLLAGTLTSDSVAASDASLLPRTGCLALCGLRCTP